MFRVLNAKLLLCIVKKCYFCSQYQYTVKEYQDLANQPTEFYYDPNGNLIADLDRNIVSIRYNVLNLPDTIQFSNGNQISNRYTADGIKRMSTYITSVFDVAIPLGSVCQWVNNPQLVERTRTYYCGNAEYEESGTGIASLQRIDFGNGYIRNNTYYYTITDYLGNISSVWNGTSNLVEQQTTYYPSGLPHRTSTNANIQRYKYNGKELITNHGYDQYDYHARGYYPAIMRFTSVDPLAFKFPSMSGYAAFNNNPIYFVDPDGRENIPALIWATKNMANKGVTSNYGSAWFGPTDNRWTYKVGEVPTRSVCYESCFMAYMNYGNDVLPTLRTGFTNKHNAFVGRSTPTGGMNWFKSGDGTDRQFVTDISKGELGDIVFMGEVGDMQGHAVLLAGGITMGTTEIDGKSYETASFYTLSTSSDTESGNYGGREFSFVKQSDGTWQQQGGAGYTFNGFGQMTNIDATDEQRQEATKLIEDIK